MDYSLAVVVVKRWRPRAHTGFHSGGANHLAREGVFKDKQVPFVIGLGHGFGKRGHRTWAILALSTSRLMGKEVKPTPESTAI